MTDLLFHRRLGTVVVTIERPVELDAPPAGVWAQFVDRLAYLPPHDLCDGTTATLNAALLHAAGHPPLGQPDRWPLWLHDPHVARLLLEHWRDWPCSPFVASNAEGDSPAREPTASPGKEALGALYRACRGVMTPQEVRDHALWEIGMLAPPERSDEPASTPTVKVGRATIRMRPDGMPASKAWTRDPTLPYRYGRFAGTTGPVA